MVTLVVTKVQIALLQRKEELQIYLTHTSFSECYDTIASKEMYLLGDSDTSSQKNLIATEFDTYLKIERISHGKQYFIVTHFVTIYLNAA